jgi:cytochrome b subunit of formate dehydrogenase
VPTKPTETKSASVGSRRVHFITIAFAVPILIFSGMGFIAKFIEFIHTFQGETDGVFAITPMVNYLLASAGFFCMLVWATINGMFYDIERPKQTMLDNDIALDRQE